MLLTIRKQICGSAQILGLDSTHNLPLSLRKHLVNTFAKSAGTEALFVHQQLTVMSAHLRRILLLLS